MGIRPYKGLNRVKPLAHKKSGGYFEYNVYPNYVYMKKCDRCIEKFVCLTNDCSCAEKWTYEKEF